MQSSVILTVSVTNIDPYTPAIITATAALFAAFLAQYLSHKYSKIREKRSAFMLKYQELFSEIMAPLSIYMTIKTNPRRLHDVHHGVEEGDLLETAFSKITENLKHISPTTLKIYERYYGYEFHEDGWGSREEADKHALIYFIFDDILRSSRWTGIFGRDDRRRFKYLRYYYGILALCLNFWDLDKSTEILTLENFSGTEKNIKYRKFNKVLIDYDHSKSRDIILKHIFSVKESEINLYNEHLKDLIV